jgi:hypothetical protein
VKWNLDEKGLPRPVSWLDEILGRNFYLKLRGKIQSEIAMANRLEKTLLALPPQHREIKMLEYQRIDFMPEAERRIYMRNQIETKQEEVLEPIEPWKKVLGWLLVVLLNLFMGFYIFLFGVRRGASTTNSWLMSFVGSLLQDPLLNMPLVSVTCECV